MKPLSGQQIRRLYKEFFAERGHSIFPSASLVPHDDPTLLWINAGMAPLKPYFDGREIPENPRIVNSQKCIRTNDIEEVGQTARHQTFFEMLGNFSFGDYFKQEAITWAWAFLTEVLELDGTRLSVTIHENDDEAFDIWHNRVGLPENRIYRGSEDNFWEIGEGPCGPCSEIFYDRGEQFGCGASDCQPGCDCDRFLEIWNLVFTQYNKGADGEYTPLPKKNIDTGSGLERLASVLQDVPNNFETDLFRPIIDKTGEISGRAYKERSEDDVHFKIVADHLRTVAFAIGDGVLPGNEGRSYIIRRLLRRAVRSGRRLGIEKPFMYRLVDVVDEVMGADYPEIREKRELISRVIKTEEERFHETLTEGEALLADRIAALKDKGETVISGADAFKLYDTYGFPIDLTIEIASESGFTVNREGFDKELEQQRERARAARQTIEGMSSQRGVLEAFTTPSTFVGYGQLTTDAQIIGLVRDGDWIDGAGVGDEVQLILDTTPFYAESGGQVADKGELVGPMGRADVLEVKKAPHGQTVHTVRVVDGTLHTNDTVRATVDGSLRKDTIKNHTATHLLHKALREVLGTHVAQAGSLVEPDRLRFDFSHFGPLTDEELRDVEQRVNAAIWRDYEVAIEEMDIDAAKALGAMALFGEKYGQRVRVVQAGDYSIELCGGCHVERTGLIGQFLIVSETGIGSGTRRIEAVTGRHAYARVTEKQGVIDRAAELLKANEANLVDRIQKTLDDIKQLERELDSAKARLNHARVGELKDRVEMIAGVPVTRAALSDVDMDGLRQLADELRADKSSYIVVLGSVHNERVQFVAAVSKDLQGRGFHAGQIVKAIAAVAGGGGGGRPDMAQAGAKDPDKLQAAIEKIEEIVTSVAGNSGV
ncbi:alanine--tRNA ligase [Alicyclobacillus fastidiosus]|uniref:Alanine--tRNA ligase n=1 Tax=Alicyclobacillus fastidiosus TaxID=392011 RepID=A0ABY6ZLI0_9BACL|nr:alanine--tRNA ligase [Alicyclobacillus fastidiosus]WAH43757.1 alanine--tRNA ligase [Alicyclobacillus fastidiosus]GMA59975.1 alanine--tRNA ligase [Alicyclobacillus fastidiosus]